jgi:hypothetical protein
MQNITKFTSNICDICIFCIHTNATANEPSKNNNNILHTVCNQLSRTSPKYNKKNLRITHEYAIGIVDFQWNKMSTEKQLFGSSSILSIW